MDHVFTGFGFGPIQAGVFVYEAFRSGNFSGIFASEIDHELVEAVNRNGGRFCLNIAGRSCIEKREVDRIQLFDPAVTSHKRSLASSLCRSTEAATCLPSVEYYGKGGVAEWLAEASSKSSCNPMLVYCAENDNRAAEKLQSSVKDRRSGEAAQSVRYLNTVIGKMSRVVTDAAEIRELELKPVAPGLGKAFLVEEFNRILVSSCRLRGVEPGIKEFVQKEDLLPFEEVKLYGHNAVHALLAYLAAFKGYFKMTELARDREVMEIAKRAFVKEAGGSLVKKYSAVGDRLFTKAGFKEYAQDLLERITNPFLNDTVERAARDPLRKLGPQDRLFGTMGLVRAMGGRPENMAVGTMAALCVVMQNPHCYGVPSELRVNDWRELDHTKLKSVLWWLWGREASPEELELTPYLVEAKDRLEELVEHA